MELTGNVEGSILLLVAGLLLLRLVSRRGHVLATQGFGKDFGVENREGVDKDATTDMKGVLVAERLEQGRDEQTKDPEILHSGGWTTSVTLNVLDDLVEAERRDVDEDAPWESPQELSKELPLEDLHQGPKERVLSTNMM